jgi:hypothetical protein
MEGNGKSKGKYMYSEEKTSIWFSHITTQLAADTPHKTFLENGMDVKLCYTADEYNAKKLCRSL